MNLARLNRIFLLCMLMMLIPESSIAASFDCSKKKTFIENAICENINLSKLDSDLANEYEYELTIAYDPDSLKESQKTWLNSVRNLCQNVSCLARTYKDRLKVISTYDVSQRNAPDAKSCEFKALKLPKKFKVFLAEYHDEHPVGYQIDQSGKEASKIDVIANSPKQPVVLILPAYTATIWNIKWTIDTDIVAVLVSGYDRQVVAGLPPDIPTLTATFENQSPCGFFTQGEGDRIKINPFSRRLFGRPVDLVYVAKDGIVTVGDQVSNGAELLTSKTTPPESFYDKSAPLAGHAGLVEAIDKGSLRKATEDDAEAWVSALSKIRPSPDLPVYSEKVLSKPFRPNISDAYVVLKKFTYPSGLYGGYAVKFFIRKGAPKPTGTPGHSCVYNFNDLTTSGPGCN